MTNSITLFQKDKELHRWWNAIAKHDNFAKCVTHAQGSLMDSPDLTPEQIKGARAIIEKLHALAELPEEESTFPSAGLNHDLEPDSSVKEQKPKSNRKPK